jgi:nucleotide-binding universal stress UspA family protein
MDAALYPYMPDPIVHDPAVLGHALDRLNGFVALTRAEGVNTRCSVVQGVPVNAILDTAKSEQTSLICLGTHGRSGVERLVLGSVAERVLRMASCPVLTVSEQREEQSPKAAGFKNILCGVDFATLSLKAVEYSLSLAQEAGGCLTLFHALEWFPDEPGWDPPTDAAEYRVEMERRSRERLEQIVPDAVRDWCEVDVVVRSGKAYRELLALARERNADLIVLGVRGRNPLDLMLFGSTTEHVVRQAGCPVLTIAGH